MIGTLSSYSRIWRDYGPTVTNPRPRLDPVEIVQEATGLHYLDLLALGFAIFGFGENWKPPKPATLPATVADFISEDVVERYLSIASASMENLADRAERISQDGVSTPHVKSHSSGEKVTLSSSILGMHYTRRYLGSTVSSKIMSRSSMAMLRRIRGTCRTPGRLNCSILSTRSETVQSIVGRKTIPPSTRRTIYGRRFQEKSRCRDSLRIGPLPI